MAEVELKAVTGTLYVVLTDNRGKIAVPHYTYLLSYAGNMAKQAAKMWQAGVFDKSGEVVVFYPPHAIETIEYDKEFKG